MIIVGIDPAITNTGFGVIKFSGNKLQYLASGVIKTNPREDMTIRLSKIANTIDSVLMKFKPQIVGMEETFVNSNAHSSLKLSYARGAIMSIIGNHQTTLHEFAPNKIKKTLTGAGHADKSQMISMIKLLIPEANISSSDEADALAVAYTCFAYIGQRSF